MANQISQTQVSKELEQYEADLSWILDNYQSLIERYGNEFVAVLDNSVLSHAKTIKQLTDDLQSKFSSDAHRVVIEYIYPKHPNLVLPACA